MNVNYFYYRQTISCYYRCMSAAIVNCVKNIPPINKESIPTAEVINHNFYDPHIHHNLVTFHLLGIVGVFPVSSSDCQTFLCAC